MKSLMWQTLLLITAHLLLLAVSAQGSHYHYSQTILVSEDMDKENVCFSFECIMDRLSDSTEVLFQIRQIWLPTTMIIRSHSNIALYGASGATTVQCEPLPRGTGLQFIGVTNLTIKDLIFVSCETPYTYQTSKEYLFRGALYVMTSVNCSIENITFINSNGRGLLFFNTNGSVSVTKSNFSQNKVTPETTSNASGGGVHIQFSKNSLSSATVYKFIDCSFINNNATKSPQKFRYRGEGGGIMILFLDSASNYHIHIMNSTFAGNSAMWGGAIHVSFHGSSHNNSLIAMNSIFKENEAMYRGGGALNIGYDFPQGSTQIPHNNCALFLNCSFKENKAIYGGGVSVYTNKNSKWSMAKDIFKFKDCTWDGNMANYGSAVDISPHVSSTLTDGWTPLLVVFENSLFSNNNLNSFSVDMNSSWSTYTTGKGALSITSFSAEFIGTNSFVNNTYSALYLVGSIADFSAWSNVIFTNNSGYDGGAIALRGFSALRVKDNSTFTFTNNTAVRKGGAIYFSSIDRHDFISTRSCFIQNNSETIGNITFRFHNNQASRGNSIYATSVLPCYYHCAAKTDSGAIGITHSIHVKDIFSCIGNFNLTECTNSENCDVSTAGKKIKFSQGEPLKVIPGKEVTLPIVLKDEFNATIKGLYHAMVKTSTEPSIEVDEAYSYVYRRRMKVYGHPSANGTIELSTLTFRRVMLLFDVEILQCPPGFVIDSVNGSLKECVCSVNTGKRYFGIRKCNTSVAFIQRQYWIGYDREVSHEHLLVGNCPSDLCRYHPETDFALPVEASLYELNDLICMSNRTGILCSSCIKGYSVYYHSDCTCCWQENQCSLGWLFYILSEIVPLTAVFITIMIFNISFTSGVANAFILFAQTFRLTIFNADRSVWIHQKIWVYFKGLHFVYRFFNLEFFTKFELSFCLWKGASTLDILAFKYITIIYGLLLIVATVVLMNVCNFKRLFHSLANPSGVHGCIIHGLTAFLVLCYSQCAKVSFEILSHTSLYGIGKVHNRTVVTHYGEIDYFSSAHLKYAIPAIFCICIIVIPLPLLLILYPAHYRLLALLGVSESRISTPLEKLKPLFDSFQGCYRDNFRFFAGFYFLFRLISELTDAFTTTSPQYYTIMITLVSIVTLLHTYCHPYVKNWHNILDSMVLLDLLLINILSMYMYSEIQGGHSGGKSAFLEVQTIEAILAILPLVYMVIYPTGLLIGYGIKQKKAVSNREGEFNNLDYPDREDISSECSLEDAEYKEIEDDTL